MAVSKSEFAALVALIFLLAALIAVHISKFAALIASIVTKFGAREGGEDSTVQFDNAQKKKTIVKNRNDSQNNSDTFSWNVDATAQPVRVANPKDQKSQAPNKGQTAPPPVQTSRSHRPALPFLDLPRFNSGSKRRQPSFKRLNVQEESLVNSARFSLVDVVDACERARNILSGEQAYGGGRRLPVQQTRWERKDVDSFRNAAQEFPACADASKAPFPEETKLLQVEPPVNSARILVNRDCTSGGAGTRQPASTSLDLDYGGGTSVARSGNSLQQESQTIENNHSVHQSYELEPDLQASQSKGCCFRRSTMLLSKG